MIFLFFSKNVYNYISPCSSWKNNFHFFAANDKRLPRMIRGCRKWWEAAVNDGRCRKTLWGCRLWGEAACPPSSCNKLEMKLHSSLLEEKYSTFLWEIEIEKSTKNRERGNHNILDENMYFYKKKYKVIFFPLQVDIDEEPGLVNMNNVNRKTSKYIFKQWQKFSN